MQVSSSRRGCRPEHMHHRSLGCTNSCIYPTRVSFSSKGIREGEAGAQYAVHHERLLPSTNLVSEGPYRGDLMPAEIEQGRGR